MAVAQKIDLASLASLLSPRQVLTKPIELLTYEVDAALDRGAPDGVAFVHSADEVVRLVKWAIEKKVPLVARGAGTGLSGGAVAEHGGVIVEFSRMNKLLEFDVTGRSVVVEPGMVNLVLDELVKTKGLYFPPDPASGRAATIGGNIAENAGGPHCFKYGVTTNYITGLKAVLADGRLLNFGGRALDYPEYDLVGILNGSEGTLGIITEASARLLRNVPAIKTMMAAFDTVEEAGLAVSAVIARGLVPATMEMMDQKMMCIIEDFVHPGLPVHAGAALIIEADGYPDSVTPQIEEIAAILRENKAHDLRIAQTAEERDKIWYGRKSAAGAMARLAPQYYLLDGTVPRSKLAQTLAGVNKICEESGLRVGYVFHAGDGNLHPFILIDDPSDPALVQRVLTAGNRVMELCVNLGGSITGEHGVGCEKRAYMPLMYNAQELALMRDVKEVFDPQQLFNPGKILPKDEGGRRSAEGQEPLSARRDPQSAIRNQKSEIYNPQSAQEAADLIGAWAGAGRRVRVRGGGTKSGGLPAADVVLSTAGLRGIEAFSLQDLYVTVRAGTSLAEMQRELARHKMWVPLVSPWAASTVGGIVATNFNAPLRMRYGGVRDLVLALTVALPDGRLMRMGRPVVKNVAGYDMPKLFVGSHGTLGLITDVTLKLMPLPRGRASLIAPVNTVERGLEWGSQLLKQCLVSSSLLVCRGCDVPGLSSPYLLIYTAEGVAEDVAAELTQARAALQAQGASGLTQLDTPSGNDLWASWLGMAQAAKEAGGETVLRVGVAAKDLPGVAHSLVSNAWPEASFIADMANGLLYLKGGARADVDAVRRAARDAGGYAVVLHTPDAQTEVWGHAPEALDVMQALKARWNPRGLFNPGAFVV